ncbi:MAG: hypothetical protein QM831_10160 [Kofleriaceae bacterium]
MRESFAVNEPFRELMRDVTAQLDWGDRPLTGPDAIESEHGSGGRIEGTDIFRFVYNDGDRQLEIELRVQQIRDIAAGNLSEVDAQALHASTGTTRQAKGEPILVWGEYDEDALRIRTQGDLALALDTLQAISTQWALAIRLWTALDDQVVCVLNGLDCAMYVVASDAGYGTSVGDPTRNETMELTDHDMGPITVRWADFVPWRVAREAIMHFAETGQLGDGVILDGTIPSQFLMLGDFDREAELESRRPPPVEIVKSSLADKAPQGMWSRRLINSLRERHLIELDDHILGSIINSVALLLVRHGHDAQDQIESANALAKEIERVRGVGALFATGGDLQIALRRTQDPSTEPVEVP